MKRAVIIVALGALVAAPAVAQWPREPVWNSPKGGTGITISGDYARPDSVYGKGNTFGGRASLGIGTFTLTAGVSSTKLEGATQSFTSIGGNAAFRLIGGSLLPIAVNLQVGATRTNTTPTTSEITGAVGFSVPLPTPGFSIEPYFSPGIRHLNQSGVSSSTEFGYALGANVGFGLFGVHLAYDHQNAKNGPSAGVFGIGAHVDIHLPLGM